MSLLSNQEEKLFNQACSDSLDEQGLQALTELLRGSEQSRERYLIYCAMHSDLYCAVRLRRVRGQLLEVIQGNSRLENPPKVERVQQTRKLSPTAITALALAAALLLAFLPSLTRDTPTADNTTATPLANEDERNWPLVVATVNRVEDVVWHNDDFAFQPKDLVSRDEELRIESGLLEIEFRQGAVVILEGPAHLVPHDPNGATLLAGKLAAVAPPWATGFRIDTPGLDVIDHGTEFAVSVSSHEGKPKVNVSVTEGEVEVLSDEKQRNGRRLTAGEGVKSIGQLVETGHDDDTRRLTDYLPDRPGLKNGEVVADRWEDWLPGKQDRPRTEGPWRYYSNLNRPFGNPAHYVDLLWDSKSESYRPPAELRDKPKYGFVRVHRAGGHPGQGSTQVGDGLDRYSIAAYIVQEDGYYHVESGWLERYDTKRWDLDDVLDVRFHVNDQPDAIEAVCDRTGFVSFRGSLGKLSAGDVIYGGVGPRGVAHGDRFRWGYYIVRETQAPVALSPNTREGALASVSDQSD